ncbi:MAG: oxidoreductase [Planctomycetes bacterium GWF2_41_51]|nr:MAG: oxidoreductase [Planctomycetes bacterium GWF2_41_51]HBG25853.1 oxidoreductase [Phycisphaerales bacterium]
MAKQLVGKVAVITGASTGIGYSTALRFVREGAYVFITGRRQKELEAAAAQIGKNVTAVQGDVSNLDDIDKLYDTVKKQKTKIDIVFANAGIAKFEVLGSITEEHYDKLFDINVKGLLFTVQKALPLMPDGGAIILNASVAASRASHAFSVYSASKAAVRSFARGWAIDLKDRKIRVNAISPGPIETDILHTSNLTQQQVDQAKNRFKDLVPLGRMGKPDEVAAAALFLASDESSFITGSELVVDGGITQT